MTVNPKVSPDPIPMTQDQILEEVLRENERLRRQLADSNRERDRFEQLYLDEASVNDPKLTAEDFANAVPAGPIIASILQRLAHP